MQTVLQKRCRNASILESFLAFFILLLVVFGALQVYRFIIAGMVMEYAAFRGARSAAVGFRDYLISREVQVKTVPVSGAVVDENRYVDDSGSDYAAAVNVRSEQRAVERYMSGTRYLEYEYWHGNFTLHNNYKCPDYGKQQQGSCSVCGKLNDTSLSVNASATGNRVTVSAGFKNYPLTIPLYEIFSSDGTLDLKRKTELTNHAAVFLD